MMNCSFSFWSLPLIALAAFGFLFSFFENGEGSCNKGGDLAFAFAALNLGSASRVLANKLALGFGALGFVALPIAIGLLANCFANRLGDLAVSHAVRLLARVNAFRAVLRLASFIWAPNFAVRLLALNIANCILGLLA